MKMGSLLFFSKYSKKKPSLNLQRQKKKIKNKPKKSSDKSMGKDNKGSILYKGPQGGKYYINSNGNKTYKKIK